jgi:hypothetical protein
MTSLVGVLWQSGRNGNRASPLHTLVSDFAAYPTLFGMFQSGLDSRSDIVVSATPGLALPQDSGFSCQARTGLLSEAGFAQDSMASFAELLDGADKHFRVNFSGQTGLAVTHYLGKYPSVNVFETGGGEVKAAVTYLDLNSVSVQWHKPLSGYIICN